MKFIIFILVFYIWFFTSSYTYDGKSYLFEIFIYLILRFIIQKKLVSTFTDTTPTGIFKVDVSTVYNEKDHAFERKWAQLINPQSVQTSWGHFLLSVAITERDISSKVII